MNKCYNQITRGDLMKKLAVLFPGIGYHCDKPGV